MKTFYVSTSIPYVNAAPHIGHAQEFVEADVIARFKRQRGDEVFFLSGTDDNALKNVIAAEAAEVPVSDWVGKHAKIFRDLLASLGISNDDFIRTSVDERHKAGAQKLWNACLASRDPAQKDRKEDIYKKSYKGLYCLGCEEFKSAGDLVNGECPEHPGKKLDEVAEENYFFKLSNYQKEIERLIAGGELRIVPESRRNEALSFVRGGLQDFSISRSRDRAKGWGVPVPGDDSQMMYVWFDALSNYINALGYADDAELFKKFWTNGDDVMHVIGKGINRFHTVYWPAMLLSAGVALPKTVFIHGYFTVNGQKMSKTLGNVVDPQKLITEYGRDAARYYVLREIAAHEDGDFSEEKFKERYNSDLANGLGNFAARVSTLGATVGDLTSAPLDPAAGHAIEEARSAVEQKMIDFRFHEALAAIWNLIGFGDAYVNAKKPWDKGVSDAEKRITLFTLAAILDNVAALLVPFLPDTAEKITQSITWEDGHLRLKKVGVLFPRK